MSLDMATVEYSSEFMTNMVAGKPIPPLAKGEGVVPGNPKRQFAVVKDEQQRPMIVHLTDEDYPKLMIIQHDEKDFLRTVDLGKACGVPPDAIIQAFDIIQDQWLMLYASFSWDYGDQNTQLNVTYPFMPSSPMESLSENRTIGSFGRRAGNMHIDPIEQIIMTPPPKYVSQESIYYPMILLLHKPKKQMQPWREIMTPIYVSFHPNKWFDMPMFHERNEPILNILPSVTSRSHGWIIQYENHGSQAAWGAFCPMDSDKKDEINERRIDFYGDSTVTASANVLDREGQYGPGIFFSDSDGLWLGFEDVEGSDSTIGLQISKDSNLKSCRSLQSTHHENDRIRIWFRNSFNEVGYLNVQCNTLKDIKPSDTKPTMLLPASDSVCVEPVALGKYMDPYWHSVIVADSNGSLSHLQQASDTGHWHSKPLYTHHDDGLHEVDSYTITVRPLQKDQSPLIEGLVQIRSSSAMTGYLNGKNVTLSPSPQWYETDFEGTLHFIIPTTSMACPTLMVTNLLLKGSNKKEIPVEPTIIDPAKGVTDKQYKTFDKIGSWEGLKNLKTQDGNLLFDQSDMPGDDEFERAFNHLQTLREAHKKLSPDDHTASFYAADGSTTLPPGSIFGVFSDIGHFIARTIHEAEHTIVEIEGKVMKFVAKIGEKVYKFILDTPEKIRHAETWVWNKLKATLKHLINLYGLFFNWNDIRNTKNTLSALITSSIELLKEKAGDARDNLSDKLDNTADYLRNGETAKKFDTNIFKPNGPATSADGLLSNTSVLWIGERLKNGGMANMSRDNFDTVSVHPDVTGCWKNTIPHVQKIQPHVNSLAEAISGSVVNKSSVSSSEVFAPAPDFAQICLDSLKSVAGELLGGIQILLEQFSKYGNAKITIPVISGLYKSLFDHDLTVFDAISLIFGIAVNTITVIITGSAPPTIDGLNGPDMPASAMSDMPSSAMSDKLAELLGLQGKLNPGQIKALKTVLSGAEVVYSIFDRIIGYFKWLKRTAQGDFTETKAFGWIEFFIAVGRIFVTLITFPTDENAPGLKIREVICVFNTIKNVAQFSAACVSSAEEATETMGVDILIVIIDTAVSVITSALGIAVGALELGTRWKGSNDAKSIASIYGSVLSATASISYFLVYIDPANLDLSVPSAIVWQGASNAKIPVQCLKWTLTL